MWRWVRRIIRPLAAFVTVIALYALVSNRFNFFDSDFSSARPAPQWLLRDDGDSQINCKSSVVDPNFACDNKGRLCNPRDLDFSNMCCRDDSLQYECSSCRIDHCCDVYALVVFL